MFICIYMHCDISVFLNITRWPSYTNTCTQIPLTLSIITWIYFLFSESLDSHWYQILHVLKAPPRKVALLNSVVFVTSVKRQGDRSSMLTHLLNTKQHVRRMSKTGAGTAPVDPPLVFPFITGQGLSWTIDSEISALHRSEKNTSDPL